MKLEISILILIIGILIFGIILVWKLPKIQTKKLQSLEEGEKFNLENEARKTLVQLFGGIFFLGTLFFSWNSYQLSKNSHLSKRFSDTISLFGNEKINARVAAIYSLENLADEYKEERETIFQIILSYVKENSRIKKEKNKAYWLSKDYYSPCFENAFIDKYNIRNDSVHKIGNDIQAAINSLIRMKFKYKPDTYLELTNLNLEGLVLENLNISNVDFGSSNLNYSNFSNITCEQGVGFTNSLMTFSRIDGIFVETNFYQTDLSNCIFTGDFINCQFGESNLYNSQFEGGKFIEPLFWSANMTNVFFEIEIEVFDPNFEGTILNCADLRELVIPKELFKDAITNEKTILTK